MEIGNQLVGHSRGEFKIDRYRFESIFEELFETLPPSKAFENDIFHIHPYYWGECTCGYIEKADEWSSKHKHEKSCFHVRYITEDLKLMDLNYQESDIHTYMIDWSKKNGLKTAPDGMAVYCDCSYEKEWDKFIAANDHKPDCPTVVPNFMYKPTGYYIMWYKYPFRDSYTNKELTVNEVRAIVRKCVESIRQ